MEGTIDILKTLIDSVKDFGKTSYELFKLQTLDKVSGAISATILGSVTFFITIFLFFFLSTGVAIWLGELLNHMYYGFFIVAFFYLICGLIVSFLMPKLVKKYISNLIIKKMLK